ncbi:MAG: type transport system ATP-binding protein [Baekduia sp.]|jgi:ABC-2 type transport system ATP-binding protein|nr:type transport system ATP-binding protein [Baekduia sp.]
MIEARGLTKRYGSTLAVDGLSFDVLPGRVTGFLGPNGAGKSTTLRMVVGLDAPTQGTVTISGRPYTSLRRPLFEVGAMLEAGAIHDGRSAYNHLLCVAQSNGIGRRRVEEVLAIVGLTSVARKRAGQFSMGMSQRLGIGVALLGDPELLIFDEPVNGLDPEGIVWIRNLMRRLAGEGRSVFVSSHLMAEMALTADHVIVIGKGRLLAEASVEDLIHGSSQNFVRVRSLESAGLASLIGALGASSRLESDGALAVTGISAAVIGDLAAAQGIVLHELSPQEASLEEAYLELTRDSVEFRAGLPGSDALAAAAAPNGEVA